MGYFLACCSDILQFPLLQNETCLPEELVGQPLYLPPLSAWLSAADSLYSLLCVEEEVWAEPALVKITQVRTCSSQDNPGKNLL